MKNLITLAICFMSFSCFSQNTSCCALRDTICVMVTLDETINFDYKTSEVIAREKNKGSTDIRVETDEVLCLHLLDEKRGFRDVTVTYDDDGYFEKGVFKSKDKVLFSTHGHGAMTVRVSKARRKE
jgi:hypothetical protein